MLVGTEMAAAIALLDPYPVDLVSLNCATGPREMGEHIRLLGQTCRKKYRRVSPTPDLPQLVDGKPHYPLTPEELADWLKRFVVEDGVNLVGGCCGTTPEHLRRGRPSGRRTDRPPPRKPVHVPQVTSIYGAVAARQENSLLARRRALERQRQQGVPRAPPRREPSTRMVDMGRSADARGQPRARRVHRLRRSRRGRRHDARRRSATAPTCRCRLMIDSTEPPALQGGARAAAAAAASSTRSTSRTASSASRSVLPLAKEHGSAVIALTIDEQGMAKTAEDKIRIARRLFTRSAPRTGACRPEDLFFDVLTFTICTGNEDDRQAWGSRRSRASGACTPSCRA